MRNRQLIAAWAYEQGKTNSEIEKKIVEGKTYFTINDYKALREIFGRLLAEIQRIKSEGDFDTARYLVETYGVKINKALHAEVLERYSKLNLAPYSGFVNPVYKTDADAQGNITNVWPDYSEGYTEQMMRYSREHSWLPTYS